MRRRGGEEIQVADALIFASQRGQHLADESGGKVTVEGSGRIRGGEHFESKESLGFGLIERELDRLPAPFPGRPHRAPVADFVIGAGEEEGAKPAAVRADSVQGVGLGEPGENLLRAVLGIFAKQTAPAQVSIDRVPVAEAKGVEGVGTLLLSSQDERPTGRLKTSVVRSLDGSADGIVHLLIED